jgi:hypothetical protein
MLLSQSSHQTVQCSLAEGGYQEKEAIKWSRGLQMVFATVTGLRLV